MNNSENLWHNSPDESHNCRWGKWCRKKNIGSYGRILSSVRLLNTTSSANNFVECVRLLIDEWPSLTGEKCCLQNRRTYVWPEERVIYGNLINEFLLTNTEPVSESCREHPWGSQTHNRTIIHDKTARRSDWLPSKTVIREFSWLPADQTKASPLRIQSQSAVRPMPAPMLLKTSADQ